MESDCKQQHTRCRKHRSIKLTEALSNIPFMKCAASKEMGVKRSMWMNRENDTPSQTKKKPL